MTEPHKALGKRGEDFAARYLVREKKWQVVDRNVFAQGGEIDIIAYDKAEDYYILVEVKTRSHQGFGHGIESITPQKIHKIVRTASFYFLGQRKMKSMPIFEVHGIVLLLNRFFPEKGEEFLVDYYAGLGGE